MTPAEQVRRALGRIDHLLARIHEVLARSQQIPEDLHADMLEGVLTKTLLDLAAHIERIAVITGLEIDGYVPPRSQDGARGLFDLVTRPTRLRPALLRDSADLRAIIRERHGDGFVGSGCQGRDLRKRLQRLEVRAIPSLRAGLVVILPILERPGRGVARTPRAMQARALHERRLTDLLQLAEEIRRLARERGRAVRFFGSLVSRRVHEESDLDVLILGNRQDGARDPFPREIEAMGQALGIPVDVVLAEDAAHLMEEAIL